MPPWKSADGTVANLVRSGRKQPQRFRAGSSASTASAAECGKAAEKRDARFRADNETA